MPISERAAALEAQRLVFDPFAPTLDPASPGAYERYAAAASLPGDLPRGTGLALKLGDASVVPAQVDIKARHADGSLRHALISLRLPVDVIERWKATGPGWQTRMADRLSKA